MRRSWPPWRSAGRRRREPSRIRSRGAPPSSGRNPRARPTPSRPRRSSPRPSRSSGNSFRRGPTWSPAATRMRGTTPSARCSTPPSRRASGARMPSPSCSGRNREARVRTWRRTRPGRSRPRTRRGGRRRRTCSTASTRWPRRSEIFRAHPPLGTLSTRASRPSRIRSPTTRPVGSYGPAAWRRFASSSRCTRGSGRSAARCRGTRRWSSASSARRWTSWWTR
mmetsp:Transcript_8154/g.33470  ORF Transcript_8154/g.33470 Transcript_8154/m.33470 type:complete len:223 (+) Transcript_8154:1207-1875(+)